MAILCWQGFNSEYEHPTSIVWSDSATCAGLAHGRDYSDSRASELKKQKCLAFVFPWNAENTWKTKATLEGFPTLIPPAELSLQIAYL